MTDKWGKISKRRDTFLLHYGFIYIFCVSHVKEENCNMTTNKTGKTSLTKKIEKNAFQNIYTNSTFIIF